MLDIRVQWQRSSSLPRVRSVPLLAAIPVLVALLLPAIFNPWGFSAFELPKVLLLRLAAVLALVAIVGAVQPYPISRIRTILKRESWLAPLLAFAFALILATLFSTNRLESFWGAYGRHQGLFTQLTYLAIFLAAVFTLRTWLDLQRLWLALVVGSLPVILYGLMQAAGLDPLRWQSDGASQILSTVGRANFVGSYLVLVMPLTLALRFRDTVRHRPWKHLISVLLLGQTACLVLTRTRAAWLGLAAAATAAILLALMLDAKRRRWVASLCILAAVAAGLALIFLLPNLLSDTAVAGQPLASDPQVQLQPGSTAARLSIWRATLRLVEQRPLLGHGPESLHPAFLRVFPPELIYYQGRRVLFDRAHNLWLDLLISAGVAGVITFGWLALAWGRQAWRGLMQATDRETRLLWLALLAAVVGHLVDLQFSFEVATTAAIFWLVLALGVGLARVNRAPTPAAVVMPASGRGTGIAALVLIVLAATQLSADTAFWAGQSASRSPESRLAQATHAVRFSPLEARYRQGLAQVQQDRGDYHAAEAQLAVAEQLMPGDPEIWYSQAELYMVWGSGDPYQLERAKTLAQQLIIFAPNIATYHTLHGSVLAKQGDLEGAVQELELATRLDATDVVAFRTLAAVYGALDRPADADLARQIAQILGETYFD